jgi:hypothetical protein
MKILAQPTAILLRSALALLLVIACEGCRRRAKSPPPPSAETQLDSPADAATPTGAAAALKPGSPAPPITNNVAPPPRVDPKTGKLILQTDAAVPKKRSATE